MNILDNKDTILMVSEGSRQLKKLLYPPPQPRKNVQKSLNRFGKGGAEMSVSQHFFICRDP